jgi:DNA invertase Pin-like site-specific DNA recombinase
MLLVDELTQRGCRVEFVERPMRDDPHDQLLLQIRSAVAEYERTFIAERMRRGRQAQLRSGQLLPWTRAPYSGSQLNVLHISTMGKPSSGILRRNQVKSFCNGLI